MNKDIPCGLDDPRLWDQADTLNAARAQRVEDYADNLLAECITLKGAERINCLYDLYDGDLLVHMMAEVANWTGRSSDAIERMTNLHNLLAEALHEVAEVEIK